MLTKDNVALIARDGSNDLAILPEMANRHGLITGATGTGKTVSLQTLAETFSAMGVPVFMSDVKGDLTGIARPGDPAGKAAKRAEEMNLKAAGYQNSGCPVCFWDVYCENGHPLRATISDVGPVLLARLLGLNDVQSGVLQVIFKIADDNGLLLLDLKDLRSMAQYVSDQREEFRSRYGQIAPATVGAITRALLRLEEQGGDYFFGEPALDVMDLLALKDGRGIINILDATRLINAPGLYSCVMLWMLSELFERLPEIGDQAKPRLIFFFDEAHLLFADIQPALLQKIEQVVRLIRSRGVGIFFVSQNPSDMPDAILGQLGNRIQHALRAFTPKDQKAVRAASQAFRANPAFSTEEAIGNLAVGEALISFLDRNGAPEMVRRGLVVPPESQIGPVTDAQRAGLIKASALAGKYDKPIDRESAYEILAARASEMQDAREREAQQQAWARARAQAEKELKKKEREQAGEERRIMAEQKRQAREARQNDVLGGLLASVTRQATRSVSNAVVREVGNVIFGSSPAGKVGKSLVRGILGGLLGGRR